MFLMKVNSLQFICSVAFHATSQTMGLPLVRVLMCLLLPWSCGKYWVIHIYVYSAIRFH